METLEGHFIASLRVVLACVLVAAGVTKMRPGSHMPRLLAAYGVPRLLRPTIAVGLPALEVLLGGGLVLSLGSPTTELAVLGLLLGFIGAMTLRWMREGAFDCGCFGPQVRVKHAWLIFPRNVLLALFSFALLRHDVRMDEAEAIGGVMLGSSLVLLGVLLLQTLNTMPESL